MVPEPLATEIDGLRRALGSQEIGRIAPHVTVAPPVNVGLADLDGVWSCVREVAARFSPLTLDLGPVASFLPRNPVCYLSVPGPAEAVAAVTDLASRTSVGPLAPPPSRPVLPFVPHVTLNQRMEPSRVPPALDVLAAWRGRCVVPALTVLEFSETEKRWGVVLEAPFAAPRVLGRGGRELAISVSARLGPDERAWSEATWAEHTAAQYSGAAGDEPFAIVAREAGSIVGVAEGAFRRPVCRLARLMVSPSARGSGIGSHLLGATEAEALSRDCERVRLEALAGERAEAFYLGRGYRAVAPLPRWRGERDFVLMERVIVIPSSS